MQFMNPAFPTLSRRSQTWHSHIATTQRQNYASGVLDYAMTRLRISTAVRGEDAEYMAEITAASTIRATSTEPLIIKGTPVGASVCFKRLANSTKSQQIQFFLSKRCLLCAYALFSH
jgi:hypothetical protein